jgi:Na+/H+ antiporter
MDHSLLFLVLLLLLLVAAVSVLAERTGFPSPVLMLLAGVLLSFVPQFPVIRLEPDVVLLLLLPPLLYMGGVGMSWRGFRSNLRPILLMAIGCVLFSAASVAFAMHELLHMPWAVGFVLGAIVSPPDAVAALALFRTIRLPRRVVTILEGEGLTNDATALVILGLALDALTTGHFSLGAAASRFALIACGEIAFGMALGWFALWLRHLARAPRSEVLLALATPYMAFGPPHALGGSGVIACVAAGLYVSWNGRRIIPPATRLQGYFIWDLVVWATESLVFLLGGLQAHRVADAIETIGWTSALVTGSLVVLTVVAVRFVWIYPATYLPRLLPSLRRSDPAPNWRVPFFIGFAGVRGVDSLVAALLVPDVVNGRPFAEYGLILFCTYTVIAATLVGLGGSLPWVVGVLGLARLGREEEQANRRDEHRVRLQGVDAVLGFLGRTAAKSGVAAAWLSQVYGERRRALANPVQAKEAGSTVKEVAFERQLLQIERDEIARAYDENRLTDEARRRIERELDLEEARIGGRHAVASDP